MFGSNAARGAGLLGICLLVAVAVGYLLATPLTYRSMIGVGSILGLIALPLVLRWHYTLMVVTANAAITIIFLPGKPSLSMLMVVVTIALVVLDYTLNKRNTFVSARSLALPLLALSLVVLLTAKATGGIGLRSLGGEVYGGRRYVFMIIAVLAFFAIVSRPIPIHRAKFLTYGYFLSGVTAVISNIAYLIGPASYFLLYVFSVEGNFGFQSAGNDVFLRLSGLAWAAMAVYYFCLCKYGIEGMMDWSRPWRMLSLFLIFALSTLGGFRSVLVSIAVIFLVQAWLEKLYRTRFFIALAIFILLAGTLTVVFVRKMPLPVQRTLSFLPIQVDASARLDAEATIDWRLDMWKVLVDEIPRYFWVGKGFAVSPTDMYLTDEGVRRGFYNHFEPAAVSGNYHNGPLTLLIPFGIWGLLAFTWFIVASWRALYLNYRNGRPELRLINIFLLSYFTTRVVFFYFLYGDTSTDLYTFTTLAGLSLALNHGIRKQPPTAEQLAAEDEGSTLVRHA